MTCWEDVKGAGLHVPSDVVTHGLSALSSWAHCEAEHHGGESTAKQKAAVLIGLGRSKMKRKEAEIGYTFPDTFQWHPSPKCPFP